MAHCAPEVRMPLFCSARRHPPLGWPSRTGRSVRSGLCPRQHGDRTRQATCSTRGGCAHPEWFAVGQSLVFSAGATAPVGRPLVLDGRNPARSIGPCARPLGGARSVATADSSESRSRGGCAHRGRAASGRSIASCPTQKACSQRECVPSDGAQTFMKSRLERWPDPTRLSISVGVTSRNARGCFRAPRWAGTS